ncbi:MAG: hypothetical protein OCD03_15245 [Hyphomicrobiales bacterium]
MAERDLASGTVIGYKAHVHKYLKKFRNRAVADISRTDCRNILETVTQKDSKVEAGAVLRILRTVINTAMRMDETILRNPINAVKIPVPPIRKVASIDLQDWWDKTELQTPLMRDLHRALLLSGARRTSMLRVRYCSGINYQVLVAAMCTPNT